MISRRKFVSGSVAVLVMVPVISCGGGDDDDTAGTPKTCDGVGANSSLNDGHTHFVCVFTSDLNNPPAGGATYTSTSDSGHTHRFTLTQADLQSISSGGTVTVTSSLDDAHTHQVTLQK